MSHKLIGSIAFGLAGCTLLAGAVTAAPPQRTVNVSYADLDLGTVGGVEALYQRLRAAARAACNPSDTIDVRSQVSFQVCKAKALERAVARIDNASLSARLKGTRVATPTASFAAK